MPFELELECDASPASQSEIVASVDGARVGTIECPARSGRVAIRQPSPGKIHVELHVVNDTATYGSFHARLWRGGETVWLVSRSSPMNKTEGCKTPAGDAHRIECVFDAPFELGKTEPGKVRTIDRE